MFIRWLEQQVVGTGLVSPITLTLHFQIILYKYVAS